MTRDVISTLSLLLAAALVARFLASVLRVPEILLLVAMGALFGPSVLDVVDVPLDSIGAQLMFTLGVSLILFYGGLNLSPPTAAPGVGGARSSGRSPTSCSTCGGRLRCSSARCSRRRTRQS